MLCLLLLCPRNDLLQLHLQPGKKEVDPERARGLGPCHCHRLGLCMTPCHHPQSCHIHSPRTSTCSQSPSWAKDRGPERREEMEASEVSTGEVGRAREGTGWGWHLGALPLGSVHFLGAAEVAQWVPTLVSSRCATKVAKALHTVHCFSEPMSSEVT